MPDSLAAAMQAFDDRVERWLAPHRSPALDPLFYGLSSAADHGLLWLALAASRGGRRGDAAWVGRVALALGLESALTNGPVKWLFRRVRPPDHYEHTDPLPYGMHRPITSSFPSGHAVSAFSAATVISAGSSAAPAWYALAGLVAASRVYVRLHHASDVVAGAALGLVLGRIARAAVGSPRPAN